MLTEAVPWHVSCVPNCAKMAAGNVSREISDRHLHVLKWIGVLILNLCKQDGLEMRLEWDKYVHPDGHFRRICSFAQILSCTLSKDDDLLICDLS